MPGPFGIYRVTFVSFKGFDPSKFKVHEDEAIFLVVFVNGRLVSHSRKLDGSDVVFKDNVRFLPWAEGQVENPAEVHPVRVEATLYAERAGFAPRIIRSDNAGVDIPFSRFIAPWGVTCDMPGDSSLVLSVWAWRRPATPKRLRVSRQRSQSKSRGTIGPGCAVITSLTAIRGLYKPGHRPLLVDRVRKAEYLAGYTSQDDKGRIYRNRTLDGVWDPDTQEIELTATVTLLNCKRPDTLMVLWRIIQPIDPTVFTSPLHPDAFDTLFGDDGRNEGTWKSPPFRKVDGFDLLGTSIFQGVRTATTVVDGSLQSKVVIRCPDVSGDRFRVQVVAIGEGLEHGLRTEDLAQPLEGPTEAGPLFNVGDITGVMTLWQRIDVEYRRMSGARALPVDQVPQHFEPGFVQLDFYDEQPCANKAYLRKHDASKDEDKVAGEFVDQVFARKNEAGTFCLVALRELSQPPTTVITSGRINIERWALGHSDEAYEEKFYDYVEVSADDGWKFKRAEGATLEWKANEDDDDYVSVYFHAHPPEGEDQMDEYDEVRAHRFYLEPILVTKAYDGRNDDGTKAYDQGFHLSPTGVQRGDTFAVGGFGRAKRNYALNALHRDFADTFLTISTPGDYTNSGFCPSGIFEEKSYFVGRTVIATRDHSFGGYQADMNVNLAQIEDDLIITIVHELCHGFGLPHRCCEWDLRAQREKTCVLNYSSDWVVDTDDRPVPRTSGKVGRHLCAFHAKELRRVRLEKNPALMEIWGK